MHQLNCLVEQRESVPRYLFNCVMQREYKIFKKAKRIHQKLNKSEGNSEAKHTKLN